MNELMGTSNRRGFLASLAVLGSASVARPALGPFQSPAPRLKFGFDNFSVRTCGWKAPRLIEYAAARKVDTLLLSDLEVYESLEDSYLATVRAQAAEAGIELQAGTSSICPTSKSYNAAKWGPAEDHARLLIRTAHRLGSTVARCYLGNRGDRQGDGGIYRHIDAMVKVLRAVKSEAQDANVKIAVENHAGDMQAWELVSLIEEAGKDFVGATMDPGNAAWTLEDPLANLEILGPYALTTGIRDSAVWETDQGAGSMWVNMGEGVVDWPAYVKRFQELCPHTAFVLEVISYKWPYEMPYLKPEFWSLFPRARAAEFARFVALAKRGRKHQLPPGRPTGNQSPELEQAQQKYDLEACLQYCRETLGFGSKP
ncbi:MAG: sugar phosphate isomerase/epimerase [Planctomycetes bacterium]|nr:sugar phosphate isomerase/epimerase [Planctomycetota bacterium]